MFFPCVKGLYLFMLWVVRACACYRKREKYEGLPRPNEQCIIVSVKIRKEMRYVNRLQIISAENKFVN